jgi:hypothetical protein
MPAQSDGVQPPVDEPSSPPPPSAGGDPPDVTLALQPPTPRTAAAATAMAKYEVYVRKPLGRSFTMVGLL